MFERTLEIIEEELLNKIKEQKILLVGVGGVGGFTFESLIRLGFQNITIIDNDIIEKSNLNRQIISTREVLNRKKVDIALERGKSINQEAIIKTYDLFLDKNTIDTVFNETYDYIIDACDTITTKVLLIKKAQEKKIKIISCMGTGNRIDPSKVQIIKLKDTYNDPLAKKMRELVKKEQLSLNIPVLWSSEDPHKTKNRTPGSIILVPAAAGLLATYFILNDLKKS